MKHNPRVNERVAALQGFRDLHPHQVEEGAQGALELMWRLQEILAEISGSTPCRSSRRRAPRASSPGLMLMRAYFDDRGEAQRRKVFIPDTAHGTNPASVTMAGFEVVSVSTDARGNVDLEELRAKVDDETVGLMFTNPRRSACSTRASRRSSASSTPRARSSTTTAPT